MTPKERRKANMRYVVKDETWYSASKNGFLKRALHGLKRAMRRIRKREGRDLIKEDMPL